MSRPLTLTLALARRLGDLAEAEAAAIGVPVTIAIVDGEGGLVYLARMEQSLPASRELAIAKAQTAASLRMTTEEVGRLAQPGAPLYGIQHVDPGRVVLFGGGMPLKLGGAVVGGLGVSGGTVEEDVRIARPVVEALEKMGTGVGAAAPQPSGTDRTGEAMDTRANTLDQVVNMVLEELGRNGKSSAPPATDGLHDTIDAAVAGAVEAQRRLTAMTLESREKIIASIRAAALANNEQMSALAVRETTLGRYEDKLRENILCATKTRGTEDITTQAVTGDHGLMLLEFAPVGVIGALTPITNPTGTLIHNSISMIAAGNAVVFNAHPSATQISAMVIGIIHKAIVDAGGPPGLIGAVRQPTLATAKELMEHPKVNMLVATGGRAVVKAVLSSGKKAIGAGAGNPPVLVDETAHLRGAARHIIDGASINNNIFCTSEKVTIVVEECASSLIKFMQETGRAYFLNREEAERVTELVITRDGTINHAYIGKNVQVILADVGIQVPDECRLAIFEAPNDHPLVWREQMMPVMPIVRVRDVHEGIEFAVAVEQGNRHTAAMHSTNIDNMTAFARAVQTTIFVKNGPSWAGLGLGGEGHTAFTIAGPTGEGLTSARTFTRQRRCSLIESFRII
jgi:propionaldehyde dehydrogenase